MKYIVAVALVVIGFSVTFLIRKSSRIESIKELSLDHISNIETIFNAKAEQFADEGVIKLSFPRTDIHAAIEGYPLDPFMGVTTWLAFQKGSKQGVEVMAMGDIVLLEHEVYPVMREALNQGISVTALHTHFLHDQPKIYFMHIEAEGATRAIASGLKKTVDVTHTVDIAHYEKRPRTTTPPTTNAITCSTVEKIIGVKGQAKNGMCKVVIGRQTRASCGCVVGKNMGINTWAAFAGTDDNAIVSGDFVVFENELQRVLKALLSGTIAVVAVHNHMIHENPRLIFLHYWGHGRLADLAHTIRKALDS